MTPINRPLTRRTTAQVRHRSKSVPIIIVLHPLFIDVRPLGARFGYHVGYDAIYDLGAKLAAIRSAEEKKQNKTTGRKTA